MATPQVADSGHVMSFRAQPARFFPACLIGVFAHAVTLAAPTTVATVSVQGNAVAGTQEILEWLSTRPDQAFSAAVVQRDVLTISENYRLLGFYAATVDSVGLAFSADSSLVDVAFRVREGRQSVVGSYFLTGNKFLERDEILSKFHQKTGDPFAES